MSLEQDPVGQDCVVTLSDGEDYPGTVLDVGDLSADHTRALVEVPEWAVGGDVAGKVEINTSWDNVEVRD